MQIAIGTGPENGLLSRFNYLLLATVLLLIFGSIGNMGIFLMLFRKTFRRFSVSILLAGKVAVDVIALFVWLLRLALQHRLSEDWWPGSSWMCRTVNWLYYSSRLASVWIAVSYTVERFLKEFHFRCVKLSHFGAVVLVFLLIGGSLAFNMSNWLMLGTAPRTGDRGNSTISGSCCRGTTAFYRYYLKSVQPWMNAIMQFLVPFIVILSGNAAITLKIFFSNSKEYNLEKSRRACVTSARSREMERFMTLVILLLNVVGLLMHTPLDVSEMFRMVDLGVEVMDGLGGDVIKVVYYGSFAVNLPVVIAAGYPFRRELAAMCELCCKPHKPSVSIVTKAVRKL